MRNSNNSAKAKLRRATVGDFTVSGPAGRTPDAEDSPLLHAPDLDALPGAPYPVRRQDAPIPKPTRTPPRARKRTSASGVTRKRLQVKAAICGGLLACILLVRAIDAGFPQAVSAGLQSALTYSVSLDDALGRLKYVDSATPVFAPSISLMAPLPGEQVQSFSALGHPYIALSGAAGDRVCAAAAGCVTACGKDDELGYYLRILHADGSEAVYSGVCDATSMRGKTVEAGEAIATLAGDLLYFQLLQSGGGAIDPTALLQ